MEHGVDSTVFTFGQGDRKSRERRRSCVLKEIERIFESVHNFYNKVGHREP